MILMIEILMTVNAWKRGWKAWALMPIIIGVMTAFLVGVSMAEAGDDGSFMALGLMVDLGIITSLGVMIASRSKKAVEGQSSAEAHAEEPDVELCHPAVHHAETAQRTMAG